MESDHKTKDRTINLTFDVSPKLPVLHGDRDKINWWYLSAVWVKPADKRFSANYAAGRQLNFRLIHHLKLFALNRVPQFSLDAEAIHCR